MCGGGQDLEPEKLVKLIDFKHLSDVITEDEALVLLKKRGANRQKRKVEMKRDGFPAYTTSAGWLGYSPERVASLCKVGGRRGRWGRWGAVHPAAPLSH